MKTIRLWTWIVISFGYLLAPAQVTQQVTTIQYYFNTDPGVGVSGNGAIIAVVPTSDLNQTFSISLPGSLGLGIHQLYIRTKDEYGRWSLTERRAFYITDVIDVDANIKTYQYFFDTDPGTAVVGNGGIGLVSPTIDFNQSLAIQLPASLSNGIHQFYLRVKDENGRWSLAERRMFYISEIVDQTSDIVSLEYYIDTDPGVGNANPYPITQTVDFNSTVMLGVPCLSTGPHYLYVRALDTYGRWSIIERDTFSVASGIEPSVVTPSGPVSICEGSSILLSTTAVPGVQYQWVESGIPIPGETGPSLIVTSAGTYALRTICGSFVVSNTVVITVMMQNTYYADADNDGFGNAAISVTGCTQPGGNVTNDDDCNDSNSAIHPGVAEMCNLLDDDCDGNIDEGVQLTFYADTDGDGYGNASSPLLACLQPAGYVSDNSDCDDTNGSVYPLADEACNGLDDNCDGNIPADEVDSDGDGYRICQNDCNDEDATIHPEANEFCNNTIDDDCDGLVNEGCGAALTVDAGNCHVVYYGYAPQACTTLTAVASGGISPYSYSWSNGGTSGSISVCPNATTVYSVTVTDDVGTTAVNGVTVEVVDVRCGNNNDKVLVCHIPPGNEGNPNTLCVGESAVADHFDHGDYLGTCGFELPCSNEQNLIAHSNKDIPKTIDIVEKIVEKAEQREMDASSSLTIFPNPAGNKVTCYLHDLESAAVLTISNQLGQVVWTERMEEGQFETEIYLREDRFNNGIYLVSIVSKSEIITQLLVIDR